MRIAYLNPCGRLGGAETSLREMLASVRAAEPSSDLWLVLGEDGPLAEIARGLGVHVVLRPFPAAVARLGDGGSRAALLRFPQIAFATARYARGLSQLLREIQPDVIHTNGFKMHLLGAWARPKGMPLVWHIHDYVSSRPLMSRLLWPFRKACAAAIANSDSVARDVGRALPGVRAVRIYNAVDMNRFAPQGDKADLDRAAGMAAPDPGVIRVGLVATFAHWKGHEVFLEALAKLPTNLPVRGYVIGGSIYQTEGSQHSLEELKREAARLNLTGRVGFTGFLQDNAAAMRSLDILVHASTQPEPFGMVIIEGMACGKAVIASRSGGAAELFEDGVDALAHPPGDALRLAQQIEKLIRDESLRAALGKAARARAEHHFHSQRLAAELLNLYDQCAARPATRAKLASSLPAVGD